MIILYLLLLFFNFTLCQQTVAAATTTEASVTYSNKTLFESLQTLSPALYNYIQSSPTSELSDLLNETAYNITLLLPNETAINASLSSGTLNFSLPTNNSYNKLTFLMLNGSYTTQTFLSSSRKFYTTLQQPSAPIAPVISIGPLFENYQPTKNIQLFSGLTKSMITISDIQCRNGIIQVIDNFLQPAATPLLTISIMPETEYMEGLLKSLNVSDTVSGMNKTILAPINEAWELANGSIIPFGTLVHNLKYLVIDGIYTSDQIVTLLSTTTNNSLALPSDYKNSLINFQLMNTATQQQQQLLVNNKAKIVKTDILTTSGVIHLIDRVLNADAIIDSTNSKSNNNNNNNNDTVTSSAPGIGGRRGQDSSPFDKKSSIANVLKGNCILFYIIFCIFLFM